MGPSVFSDANGEYLGFDGAVHPAAVSFGRRPTFHDRTDGPLLEAFLLDFSGDLYGEAARVSFVAHLREERRFDSRDALVAQMTEDVVAARAALGEGGPLAVPPPS